jgi:hypothetical protein
MQSNLKVGTHNRSLSSIQLKGNYFEGTGNFEAGIGISACEIKNPRQIRFSVHTTRHYPRATRARESFSTLRRVAIARPMLGFVQT